MSFDNNEPVLSNEEYVDAGGFACPGCGDTRFLKVERFIVAQATLRCTECKATWTEEYTLARYSNFNPDLTR
jgi:transposase-like protein